MANNTKSFEELIKEFRQRHPQYWDDKASCGQTPLQQVVGGLSGSGVIHTTTAVAGMGSVYYPGIFGGTNVFDDENYKNFVKWNAENQRRMQEAAAVREASKVVTQEWVKIAPDAWHLTDVTRYKLDPEGTVPQYGASVAHVNRLPHEDGSDVFVVSFRGKPPVLVLDDLDRAKAYAETLYTMEKANEPQQPATVQAAFGQLFRAKK